jgi:3-methyladenine DNA glycosylase AlkD
MIKQDVRVAQYLQAWKDSTNVWKQRAACVSFVKLARHGKFNDDILGICAQTVRNPYRFVQLGTGWVLRELWLAAPRSSTSLSSAAAPC